MNATEIIILVSGILLVIFAVIFLFITERNKVIEWLKLAVSDAEKQLGNKTGELKLAMVYKWFCQQFPKFSAIVTFKLFSSWVDTALITMREWLEIGNPIGDCIMEVTKNGTLH